MKKSFSVRVGMLLLVLLIGLAFSGCQKSEEATQDQTEVANMGLDIGVVKDKINNQDFVDSKYYDQCTIKFEGGYYVASLSPDYSGVSIGATCDLSDGIWSDYGLTKAYCKAIAVEGNTYLVIYGEDYDKFIEVVAY